MSVEELPEGTDAVVNGAGVDEEDEAEADALDDAAAAMTVSSPPRKSIKAPEPEVAEPQTLTQRIEGFKGQAGDRARDFVSSAKERATDGIDDVVRMIEDAAAEVDDKVGTQYGDYIRRAADSVSGVSSALKDRDADALFTDARALIAKAPGVAIGAAAAIGFVLARVARAGVDDAAAAAQPRKAA